MIHVLDTDELFFRILNFVLYCYSIMLCHLGIRHTSVQYNRALKYFPASICLGSVASPGLEISEFSSTVCKSGFVPPRNICFRIASYILLVLSTLFVCLSTKMSQRELKLAKSN